MSTLIIDKFNGSMTQYFDGDINSGYSNVLQTFGNDPFNRPGNLTWSEPAVQIDPTGSVITDMILAGKERVESGVLYVYAIGHTGRLYKIQVNDPATFNPDYDNPVLLATLTAETPTFTRGGFIDFFGATEKIYIGHDKGVTSINFDGTGEAFVGVLGSWTQNVPRPLQQFVGKLYIGNGTNLAEIDSGAIVTDYTKLEPAFPNNTQVRDIDVSPDGTYLQAVVSRLALPDITLSTQDTTYTASSDSFIFKWNGTDVGYTSFDTFPSFALASNIMFQSNQYTFGSDQRGGAIYNPVYKIITDAFGEPPLPNALSSSGNLLTWVSTFYFVDHLEMLYLMYGPLDFEVGTGYWCPFGQTATAPETDVVRIPCMIQVSNLGRGSSSNGYPENVFGYPKVYFSTLETSPAPTTKYRFYKWYPAPTGQGNAMVGALYQTQTQILSKKVKLGEIRIYTEPMVTGNSFQIDIIGSDGNPIQGSSYTFTVGSNVTAGQDYSWYNPSCAPTYAIGARITNLGETNMIFSKIEIDYYAGGK